MNSTKNIERLFDLADKNLATISATLDYSRITDTIIKLAEIIIDTDTDENIWYLGECRSFTLSGLIVGAYWHYVEWHRGQYSNGYHALSVLGVIYSPGMEVAESDNYVYQSLKQLAEAA